MDFTFDRDNFRIVEGESFDPHMGRRILAKLDENANEIHQIEVTTGAEETCASFRLRTIRMANALRSRGLNIGDVVLLCAGNHNDLSVPFVACQYIGLLPLGLAVGMTKVEVRHLASIAKPKIVFCDPSMLDVVAETFKELFDGATEIVVFGQTKDKRFTQFSDMVVPYEGENEFKCEDFNANETPSVAACSSGTTGLPKILFCTHRAVYLQFMTSMPYNKVAVSTKSPLLTFSNISWSSGMHTIFAACLTGAPRLQSALPYSPDILRKALDKYKPPRLVIGLGAMSALLKNPPKESIDFSSVRLLMSGGSSLPCEVFAEFEKMVPNATIINVYGISEVGYIWCNTESARKPAAEIPKGVPWKIVDAETRKPVAVNEIGELCLKSVTMFKGYLNNPVTTEAAFDDDGYFKSGDLVFCDEEGNVHVVDRLKEMIKSRGYHISPLELEDLIISLPEVANVCVVGVRHPIDLERPMAFVQLVDGATLSADAIKELVSNTLSSFKALTGGIVFVEKFTLTHSGKIDRKSMKALASTANAG